MPTLVGQKAPDFKLDGVLKGEFKTVALEDYKGKWLLLFFYPLDFTFVWPTEITGLSDRLSEFQQRGCEIVGVSVDSKFSHQQWMGQPRNQGGIQGTAFPVLSDMKKTVSRDYGVLAEGAGICFRGTFIVNPDGVVEVESVNNFPIGRSSDELLRLVDAAQESKKGMVCPMNFAKGKEAINPKEAKAWFGKHAK